jgi:hypothetical protein
MEINGIEFSNLRMKNNTFDVTISIAGKKIGRAADKDDGFGVYVHIPNPISEAQFEIKWKNYFLRNRDIAIERTEAGFIRMVVDMMRPIRTNKQSIPQVCVA